MPLGKLWVKFFHPFRVFCTYIYMISWDLTVKQLPDWTKDLFHVTKLSTACGFTKRVSVDAFYL